VGVDRPALLLVGGKGGSQRGIAGPFPKDRRSVIS